MSIDTQIKRAIREKKLFYLELLMPSDTVRRTMLLHPDVKQSLDGPWVDVSHERRMRRLQADLEAFVVGQHITMCLAPFKHRTAFMGLLNPPENRCWDIRSRDPSPGIRVFGCFAKRDVFVATNWCPRSRSQDWSKKKALGPRDSNEWRDEIMMCRERWKEVFDREQAIKGNDVDDYIAKNATSV